MARNPAPADRVLQLLGYHYGHQEQNLGPGGLVTSRISHPDCTSRVYVRDRSKWSRSAATEVLGPEDACGAKPIRNRVIERARRKSPLPFEKGGQLCLQHRKGMDRLAGNDRPREFS